MAVIARNPPSLPLNASEPRMILALSIFFMVLTTIAIALRVYSRKLKRQAFIVEDYLIFCALIVFYLHSLLTIVAVILGGDGHHIDTIQPSNLDLSLKLLAAKGVCYGVELALSKISICLLYQRVFFVRSFRVAARLVMALVVCWGILAGTCTWAFCSPIAYNWDTTIPGGHCIDRDALFLAVGIIDVIGDFLLFLLPLPTVWKLQVPRASKLGLLVIFSIAIISIILSGLRAKSTTLIDYSDFTYSTTQTFIYSVAEPATSIIVASSMVLRPVFEHWFRSEGSSSAKPGDLSSGTSGSFKRMFDLEMPLQKLQNGRHGTAVTGRAETWLEDTRALELGLNSEHGMEGLVGNQTATHNSDTQGIRVRQDFGVERGE